MEELTVEDQNNIEIGDIFARKSALMLSIERDHSLKEQVTVDEFEKIWQQQDNEEEDFGEAMSYYYSELKKRG